MADDQDPMAGMWPPADNPEYHRKKAEHEERLGSEAADAVLSQHGHLADRIQRVRKNPPQAAAPVPPPPRPEHRAQPEEPKEGTGLQVDPSLATRYQQEEAPAPQPAPQQPALPVAPPTVAPTALQSSEHPILKKLREDFGIEKIPFEEVTINKTLFTLRVLDTASVTSALRFADTLSSTPRENTINLQIALISYAVLAVDGTPMWQMFDIPLGQDEKIIVEGKERAVFDPMNPSPRVRTLAATSFMDFLNSSATASLSEELWKAYNERVDPKGSLQALMERISSEGEDTENIPLP